MNTIRQIDAEATFAVRHSVLRAGKPVETCKFDGDNLPVTMHFGYYQDDNLVGVASLYKKSSNLIKNFRQFQLRGMAVLDSHQNMGIGASLYNYCKKYCLSQQHATMWFNARSAAVPFYKSMHAKIRSEAFIIPEVGEHYVMVSD